MLERSEAHDLLARIAAARFAADVEALAQMFHDDAVFHVIGLGAPMVGRAAIRAALDDLVARFEFVDWTMIQIFVHGDEIAARHRLKVKHRPSGTVAETETCEFLTMEDGRCRAYTQFADTALIGAMSAAAEIGG